MLFYLVFRAIRLSFPFNRSCNTTNRSADKAFNYLSGGVYQRQCRIRRDPHILATEPE
jgi:hypothetical protein